MPMHDNCCGDSIHHLHGSHAAKKVIWTLVAILLAYLIFFLGTLIRNNIQKYHFIGRADRLERTITVDAQGKVTARPDIAMTTMGMVADGQTVADAQQKNTTVMNALVARLKAFGIDERDIQTTGYNIYPQYNYTQKDGRELLGYEVQQQVTIKIRDLAKASKVLALAGEVGANSVSGLQFTIDDREVYKAQARELAMQKIRERTRMLSRSLGVDLGEVVAYNEYEGGPGPIYRGYESSEFGMGGDVPTPTVESGSMDVLMNVQVTFEIR